MQNIGQLTNAVNTRGRGLVTRITRFTLDFLQTHIKAYEQAYAL